MLSTGKKPNNNVTRDFNEGQNGRVMQDPQKASGLIINAECLEEPCLDRKVDSMDILESSREDDEMGVRKVCSCSLPAVADDCKRLGSICNSDA
jgi:hypothetical protein